jgi:hypothetical protein
MKVELQLKEKERGKGVDRRRGRDALKLVGIY